MLTEVIYPNYYTSSSTLQPRTHLIRHAVEVTIRVKNAISAPTIIAPIILVAANSIARSMSEIRIVPRIPIRRMDTMEHTHRLMPEAHTLPDKSSVMPR